MSQENNMIVFGPIPSRRLGRSLGINNIPPKVCSYSCIYCQVGRTTHTQIERQGFYDPEVIVGEVRKKVKETRAREESIDYVTFVSDGEPTLDSNLGAIIEMLRPLAIKIAVVTNASLMWREDVHADLNKADWVSLKIDTGSDAVWHKINRPHPSLQLERILQGIQKFSETAAVELTTETMLIRGVNDDTKELEKTARFIRDINAQKSYLSIPTRPPAEQWVCAATEQAVNRGYQIFKESSIEVECLMGYEGNDFAFTGNVEEDVLSITSVHPLREEAINEFLRKAKAKGDIIEKLIHENKLVQMRYDNKTFYLRKIHGLSNTFKH